MKAVASLRTPAPARVNPDIWTSYVVPLFRASSVWLFTSGFTVTSAIKVRPSANTEFQEWWPRSFNAEGLSQWEQSLEIQVFHFSLDWSGCFCSLSLPQPVHLPLTPFVHSYFSPSLSRSGTRCSRWRSPAGSLGRLRLGWTTTAAPQSPVSRWNCWRLWEHRQGLRGKDQTGCWWWWWRWCLKAAQQPFSSSVLLRRLTSFHEVEVRAPVCALAVVDALHVAGVLVWPHVHSQAVSSVRLQRLYGSF